MWTALEDIMLSAVSQRLKDKECMIPPARGLEELQMLAIIHHPPVQVLSLRWAAQLASRALASAFSYHSLFLSSSPPSSSRAPEAARTASYLSDIIFYSPAC